MARRSLEKFQTGQIWLFRNLVYDFEAKGEIVVSFMAVLELTKMLIIKLHQMSEFGPIHCKPAENIKEHILAFEKQFKDGFLK